MEEANSYVNAVQPWSKHTAGNTGREFCWRCFGRQLEEDAEFDFRQIPRQQLVQTPNKGASLVAGGAAMQLF